MLELLALTPIQIWQTDLDAFLVQWRVSFLHRNVRYTFKTKTDEHHTANLQGLESHALRR